MLVDRDLNADHEVQLRLRYCEFLAGDGFQAAEAAKAASGSECADQLRRFRTDVLVLEPAVRLG